MKRIFDNNRPRLKSVWALLAVLLSAFLFTSCDKDDLEIQQNFPFEVSVMPVPGEVANGQTVEIRITIQPTGNYANTAYSLRYFQFDGTGTLQYYSEPPYLPNDLYPLASTQFRLYYTSTSTVSQSFDVWISDNFGNEKQLSFEFNSSD
ncbi:DUF3872 domain-containing protein [Sphingobacterium siyangense]|uniref:Uncharacterized protein DUF3872 n=1 Tax=Sphingobacterium siyangense TaxID=459529 RepID=A0A562MG17_9SPHI|nr:DUF3872 domain-containing protein [Sphingobacterium siyangense]TWI18834.1 uncharacterized protein DUF3872 [Sphingobacterium siyangense]